MNFAVETMNSIIIDTNPLVYIYNAIPDFGKKYANLLGELSLKNILVIPKIVYGELSLMFEDVNELNAFLRDTGIVIGDIKPEAYLIAAKRCKLYNKRRVVICQRCGKKLKRLTCTYCNSEIKIRQHILTDFIIGAYALQTKRRKIVTGDRGYYSSYFPELNIITIDSPN